MPLLYREDSKAFVCFQEEIIRRPNDGSFFAWQLDMDEKHYFRLLLNNFVSKLKDKCMALYFLADSSKYVENSGSLPFPAIATSTSAADETSSGEGRNFPSKDVPHAWIGMLGCSVVNSSDFIGIILSLGGGIRHREKLSQSAFS